MLSENALFGLLGSLDHLLLDLLLHTAIRTTKVGMIA